MCTSQTVFQQKESHSRQPLLKCNFSPWALNNLHTCFIISYIQTIHTWQTTQHNNSGATMNSRTLFLVVTHSKGLSERFSKACRSLGIQVHFKGSNTICNLLVAPKDKDSTVQKSGVIYRHECTQADCEEEYIGELGRTFGDRLKEHMSPSPIYQHSHGM